MEAFREWFSQVPQVAPTRTSRLELEPREVVLNGDGEVIKGAIDYILLPLTMLAVSGPVFVIMYIVMGAVEFKLPPNTQAGRGLIGEVFDKVMGFL